MLSLLHHDMYLQVEPLTYTEFNELLEHVNKQALTKQGYLISALHSMNTSLTKALSTKYQQQYREFISQDNQIIHSVSYSIFSLYDWPIPFQLITL